MDSSNVLNTVKVVKSKSTKKKSSVNKSFKCIVIDDSDDDELFFGLNKRPNSANIEKQSDLIVPVVVNEKKARSIDGVKIETAKVHKKNEGIGNNDIHRNKNEAVEDIDFLIEKPDDSCIIPPDNTLSNSSLPENYNEVIEIIDYEGTSMEELAKVFNEQVKMKFNSNIRDVKDEKKTCKGNNTDSNEEKSELLPVSAENELIEKVVTNKIDQTQAPFTGNNLSETSTSAIPESSITQPINIEKISTLPPNTSQDKPANIEENKVDLEESKVNNVAMTFGNFSSKDKTDENNLDNDVIMTVFPTRERSKIWESMKTKKLVVPMKKVVHPVLVKETKVVELEQEETVSVQEPVVTPLMEFQNQLQHQIKDLVSTLQELHTVEKNAILNTISQQQESTHKQALESIVDMLIEKKTKLEATISPKVQSQVELSDKMGEKPLPMTNDEQQNRIFSGSRNFAENIMRRDSPLNNQNNSDLSAKSSVSNNHSVLGHCESNKVVKKIRNPQNAVSILQTPVHRKKPPVPFSEMSKKSSVSCKDDNATKNVVPISDRRFALFHEILKDCSSTDVSVQSNLLSSTSKTPNLPSSLRSNSCETSSTLKEVVSHPPNSSNTSKTNEDRFSVNDFSTDISNASKPSNSSHSIDLASDVISQKEQNNAKPNALYSKVNTDYKNSIDERLSKMRNELINPENKWIYESKENVATDGCLQNAQKVLKEVQNAKTLIDKNENFKYAEMLKYFEANPYLVEPDLLDVKKNIDENIKQMTTEIQTKIYCSDDQVDENPVVQKKVNSKRLPLRNLNKKVSKTRWK